MNKEQRKKLDANQRLILNLQQEGANILCADCQSAKSTLADTVFGVFICEPCGKCHRLCYGTNVISVLPDVLQLLDNDFQNTQWCDEDVNRMIKWGNKNANEKFGVPPPSTNLSSEEMFEYVQKKYSVQPKPRRQSKKTRSRSSSTTAAAPPSVVVPVNTNRRASASVSSDGAGANGRRMSFTGFLETLKIKKSDQKDQLVESRRGSASSKPTSRAVSRYGSTTASRKSSATNDYKNEFMALEANGFTNMSKNLAALQKSKGSVEKAVELLKKEAIESAVAAAAQDINIQCEQLKAIGFTDDAKNRKALEATNMDVDRAVELLVEESHLNPSPAKTSGIRQSPSLQSYAEYDEPESELHSDQRRSVTSRPTGRRSSFVGKRSSLYRNNGFGFEDFKFPTEEPSTPTQDPFSLRPNGSDNSGYGAPRVSVASQRPSVFDPSQQRPNTPVDGGFDMAQMTPNFSFPVDFSEGPSSGHGDNFIQGRSSVFADQQQEQQNSFPMHNQQIPGGFSPFTSQISNDHNIPDIMVGDAYAQQNLGFQSGGLQQQQQQQQQQQSMSRQGQQLGGIVQNRFSPNPFQTGAAVSATPFQDPQQSLLYQGNTGVGGSMNPADIAKGLISTVTPNNGKVQQQQPFINTLNNTN